MTVRAEIRPIPQPPREVVLTMPYDVAVTLMSLAGHVSGDTHGTYREDCNIVFDALRRAGVENSFRFIRTAEAAPRPSHKD